MPPTNSIGYLQAVLSGLGALSTLALCYMGKNLPNFLWGRKDKIWKFYNTFKAEVIAQGNTNPLDSKRWGEIVGKNIKHITSELSGVLGQFELEYLLEILSVEKDTFCGTAMSSTNLIGIYTDDYFKHKKTSKIVTDRSKAYAYKVKELLYWKFFFFGLGLWLKSLWWGIFTKEDKGFTTTTKTI